ncbi:MAG: tRNA 2-thiouridine(34) synthase MnmA [Nitrospiraceae bacterium]|nr:tRNA 2-thiouridine(34) synthase MnmA [Nitrospiraceae bacterium]
MPERILVAMSGGVDSSLTAALLREQGFLVEGVTMKLTAGICCDIASAQAVCSHLQIPHHVVDMQEEFTRVVIRNFVDEYRCGRTPNPCIACNDLIKFERLLSYANEKGFARLATGHYARIEQDARSKYPALKKGVDPDKDQSYFLYRLTRNQMHHVLFPMGELRKTDVRRMAAERGLPAAERPESQDICFVPENDYRSFLAEQAPETVRGGEMVLADGTVVGRHEGVAFYTVGQRRGLGVAAENRLYVIRIDPEKNRVVLGKKEDLAVTAMSVGDCRFAAGDAVGPSFTAQVKVRYRSTPAAATVRRTSPTIVAVDFSSPVAGVTPGQAAVFYDDDTVIGGGIIENAPMQDAMAR